MKNYEQKESRFDTRLSKEQKLLFERAATIGGYRSLSDFVISTVDKKANEIIEKSEQTLASQKDCDIFFEALMKPANPNINLRTLAEDYKKRIEE